MKTFKGWACEFHLRKKEGFLLCEKISLLACPACDQKNPYVYEDMSGQPGHEQSMYAECLRQLCQCRMPLKNWNNRGENGN